MMKEKKLSMCYVNMYHHFSNQAGDYADNKLLICI